jgi:PIN domain nuclease of toxin-antitoxin system
LKLLIDTHIWIWLLGEPKRLGGRTLRFLRSRQHEVWISPISTVEVISLHQKGKIRLPGDLEEWLANATVGTKQAPLTHEVGLACREFPLDLDPNDRILAATALIFGLTLVTADRRLLELKNIRSLANR